MPRIKGVKKEKIGNYNNVEKKRLLLLSLNDFFSTHLKALREIHKIIDGKSTSLRLIDYFITNYSKIHNVHFKIISNDIMNIYFVNNDYKNQLKSFTKKHFDPFKREQRIKFKYLNEKDEINIINTTIGQLNFFRWIIKNNILTYINEHSTLIEESMNKFIKEKKEKKKNKNKLKPNFNLLKSMSPPVEIENISIVSFD